MRDAKLAALRDRIQPRWTEGREAQVRANLSRRGPRRRAAAWMALSATLVVAASGFLWSRKGDSGVFAGRAMRASSGVVPLLETSATPLTADTELVADPGGGGREFVLRRGSARFVVSHDEHHVFKVHVGSLIIEDVGTIFSVVRFAGDRVECSVEQGRVRVESGTTVTDLAAGDRETFDCASDGSGLAASPLVPATSATQRDASPTRSVPAWHRLAESGDYADAYESLRKAGQGAVRDETQELLLAADAARLSGHPDAAVPFLEQVVRAHGEDARVELAAFTLGRVLMDELGRPFQAAAAFQRSRAVGGPLAEDALAREVEAWSRAAETARARALALEYQRAYPGGRRSKAVAKFGGLE
jgi:transmembrane sensor